MGAGENEARFCRNILKDSVAQIRKKAVGLLVVGRLEKVNQIIYVGISREQILPAVVIEVE